MDPKVADHLLQQQCSRQWRFFLEALTDVFSRSLNEDELHRLMRDIGHSAASALNLPDYDDIDELQQQINRVWEDLDWGLVEFTERDDHLEIRHCCVPLDTACGPEARNWSGGFLEGLYDQLFQALGAGPELRVVQAHTDEPYCLIYELRHIPAA